MKLSINLLKQYLTLDISIEELAQKLTFSGFEVESIEPLVTATSLVVGYVKECDSHPNSDHLNLTLVDIGTETVQIVCGAPNVKQGQKVIVAKVGSNLPNVTIKATKIRGVESYGMICSLLELGIDEKNLKEEQIKGIEVLEDSAIVGSDPLAFLGLDDVILDVSVMPNRNDCNGFFSLAKEIAAILNTSIKLPVISDIEGTDTQLSINSTTCNCDLFYGRIIRDITIKESPLWLKNILNSYNIKTVNNVVDISNLIMLETGQPLHFYDLQAISSAELSCSDDYQGVYQTLDGNSYDLEKGDLVIKSNNKVVGIAGIMGGDDSKITNNTSDIIIESANFNLASIRKTSRRLNLITEAAVRFSKGITHYDTKIAIIRATNLLIELADAKIVEKIVKVGNEIARDNIIELSLQHCNKLLSSDFTVAEVSDVFKRLNFDFSVNNETFLVKEPNFRSDIKIPVDLIEEVVRILGFDRIKSKLPTISISEVKNSDEINKRTLIKNILRGYNISEIINYSLVSQELINRACLPIGEAIELANPISTERKFYRNSLLPSMYQTIAYNHARFQDQLSFFEIAKVYTKPSTSKEHLCIAISHRTLSRWANLKLAGDFYLFKGIIEGLFEEFGFDLQRIYFKDNI
ncbi:MAG: phenylalanine--tRNA ligase subunit beta, partial [Erysipelotrichaceae bacterium]